MQRADRQGETAMSAGKSKKTENDNGNGNAAIEQEQKDACINFVRREQCRVYIRNRTLSLCVADEKSYLCMTLAACAVAHSIDITHLYTMPDATPPIVASFLDYLRYERRYSAQTLTSYGTDLQLFEAFFRNLDEGLTWATVDADVVRDWVEHQMDRGNSAATVNRRLSALRALYRYAMKHHLVNRDPVRVLKGPKKSKPLPKFLKEGDMNRLLDDIEWGDTFADRRDRLVLLLFYSTGMRVSELIGLDDADVDYARGEIRVVGKGNKQRNIPFAAELHEELQRYQALRDSRVERQVPALIVSDHGRRMTYAQVARCVKQRLSLVTTQQQRSPHVLRHTFATAMMNHDAGLETVQHLLGHESLRTTTVYTHTTFEQLRQVYAQAHPRAKKINNKTPDIEKNDT